MSFLMLTPAYLVMVHRETFAGAPEASLGTDAKYIDADGHRCAHQLRESSDPTQRSVDSLDSETAADDPTDPDDPHEEAGPILGYDTFYVDTLGADGSAGLHTDGAAIGVVDGVRGSDDGFAFELDASGIDGMTIVCSHPFTPEPPAPLLASARGEPSRVGPAEPGCTRAYLILTRPAGARWDSVREPQGLARGGRRAARLG